MGVMEMSQANYVRHAKEVKLETQRRLGAPKNTPAEIVDKLNTEINAAR
jgi:hypothetical protein